MENAGGLGVCTWPRGWQQLASPLLTCRPSFQRGCGCSQPAAPARTMGSMPSPPRWPPGATSGWQRSMPRPNRRCCAYFLRGAKTWWPSVPGRSRPPPRASARPRPRRGDRGTLSTHRAARILRGIRPQEGASDLLRRRLASEILLRDIRTLQRKIADLNERIEAEVEASGTTLTEIFGVGPILAAKIMGTG